MNVFTGPRSAPLPVLAYQCFKHESLPVHALLPYQCLPISVSNMKRHPSTTCNATTHVLIAQQRSQHDASFVNDLFWKMQALRRSVPRATPQRSTGAHRCTKATVQQRNIFEKNQLCISLNMSTKRASMNVSMNESLEV